MFSRLMYRALVWKERHRARRVSSAASDGGTMAPHLVTGQRGETLAYWYLRQAGYIIVARNRPSAAGAGELDLIGWDGPVLAFVEVKTRTSEEGGPPEAAVSRKKQKRIARTAAEYLQRMNRKDVNYRFDVVSVFWEASSGLRIRLTKDAFKV